MKSLKPVVRWVIGNCHELGYEVFYKAVLCLKSIYKNRFTYCICFNSKKINQNLKKVLAEVDLVFDQKKFYKEFNYNPLGIKGPHWKLYPARLFEDTHEIILDNDLVIYKELNEIEEFLLNSNLFITTEALKRSYNKKYDKLIKHNFNINTGIVGLPPNYDYKKKIQKSLDNFGPGFWSKHFDEQTIVASILQNEHTKIIPFNTISTCCNLSGLKIGEKGTHFLGANHGFDHWWKEFRIKIL